MIKTWQESRDIHEHLMGPISHTIRCELMQAEIDALRKALAQQVAVPVPLSDKQIASIAQQTQSAEPGNDGYILPFTFARAIEAHHGIGAKP